MVEGLQRVVNCELIFFKGFKEKTMTTKIFITRGKERIAIEEKNKIEKECMKENIKKITQTNNTPPNVREI